MPTTDRNPPVTARERLMTAAAALFYTHGITATGIDAITARAGVAKQSLYNNFSSKAELIAAYIEARHAEWLALYNARAGAAQTPRDGVRAVFEAYIDHASLAHDHGFRGCGLLNAAAELPADAPGRAAVRRHKQAVEALLQAHVAARYPQAPVHAERMARHLAFLLEGAMTRAGLDGHAACLTTAQTMALELIEAP